MDEPTDIVTHTNSNRPPGEILHLRPVAVAGAAAIGRRGEVQQYMEFVESETLGTVPPTLRSVTLLSRLR